MSTTPRTDVCPTCGYPHHDMTLTRELAAANARIAELRMLYQNELDHMAAALTEIDRLKTDSSAVIARLEAERDCSRQAQRDAEVWLSKETARMAMEHSAECAGLREDQRSAGCSSQGNVTTTEAISADHPTQPTSEEVEAEHVSDEELLPMAARLLEKMDAERLDEIYNMLKSVLCNPDGKCCINGSDADRAEVDAALGKLAALRAKEK